MNLPVTEINTPIAETNFIVVDLETTGLSASGCRITEVGLVHVLNGKIIDEYSTLVNPRQFIPSYITDLTGITNEMVYDKPPFEEVVPKLKEYFNNNSNPTVFTGHNVSFDYKFFCTSFERAEEEKPDFPNLCTCRIARRLNLGLRSKSLYSLSRHFKIKVKQRHRALDDARATAEILLHFINALKEDYGVETTEELLAFQYKKIYEKDKIPSNIKRIKEDIKNIPSLPGVYKMYGKSGELLYIGKAKALHNRVNSYFYHNISHTPKVRKLIRQVNKVEYEITGSELSALILESSLIKKHKPHFNSAMKRHKKFPFIKLDIKSRFPRIEKTFEIKLDGAKYYGPFKSNFTADSLLERIDKTNTLRKCKERNLNVDKGRSPCMYHDIGQCKAPCNLSESYDDYKKEVKKVIRFLESEASPGALRSLEKKMKQCSDELDFEEASVLRDRLEDLKKVLMNLELTNSEVNLKNFVIKCGDAAGKSSELFFVSSGKLVKTISLNGSGVTEENGPLKELVNNIYFRGNLFSNVIYNLSTKFTREELDKMKIISNWIYLNNSAETLIKIDEKTRLENIMDFVSYANPA